MKRLIFMRHGYLERTYSDYSALTFEEFESLLTKAISPALDYERTRVALESKTNLSDIKLIFCSEERRSIETAQVVRDITGINFRTSPLLNEIFFVKGIINPGDMLDINHLRAKIITQFYNYNHSEDFNDVKRRLLQFIDSAKESTNDAILCISHGWFMRLVYIYSIRKTLKKISLQDLLDAKVPDFLETIEIGV